jgi:hypothetical protein
MPNQRSKVAQAFHELRQQLGRLVGVAASELILSRRFVDLIPDSERRQVWRQLREAGVELPDLRLPGGAFMVVLLLVCLPVVLLCVVFDISCGLILIEAGALAQKLSRPWATFPECGCETLHEAVLHLTPFAAADYQAGLWPPADIEARVRWIISCSLNVPFASIDRTTRLLDICEC